MNPALQGRTAWFWLTVEGKEVLAKHLSPEGFQAFVHRVDEQGAWVHPISKASEGKATGSVVLVKWQYLATARYELPVEASKIGSVIH